MKRVPVYSSQKQGRGRVVGYMKCDDRDYPILSAIRWRPNTRDYPRFFIKNSGKMKTVALTPERIVIARRLRAPLPGEEIDHISRDRYDVRLQNLRYTDRRGQTQNRKKHSNNTSGFKGVYFAYGHWRAQATLNGRAYYNGTRHKTRLAANLAAIALRKRLGFLDSTPGPTP